MDRSSCWLNSCLQLILTALDHTDSTNQFTSDLGNELINLKFNEESQSLDPTETKNILVSTENTRVALRLSELESEISDPIELQHQLELVERLCLDLYSGQQCVKDFFLCLCENAVSWPDVCSIFNFSVTYSTLCCACDNLNTHETIQLYIEIPVPQYQ